MRYTFSERAQEGLNEIVDYIALDSQSAAKSVVYAITHSLELLTTMPEMGRVYDKLNGDEIRVISVGKYVQYQIYYRVLDDDQLIDVLLVVDGRRDTPTLYNKWREEETSS